MEGAGLAFAVVSIAELSLKYACQDEISPLCMQTRLTLN